MQCLDFRTLPCPQPVVQCRAFLVENNPETLQVLVDNDAAVENVTRYLTQQGYDVRCEPQGADFALMAHRDVAAVASASHVVPAQAKMEDRDAATDTESILVFITTETLGRGDDTLGTKLMNTFLATLPEMGAALWRVVLLNGGVKLAAHEGGEDSDTVKHLKALEGMGATIMVCGACMQHYGLLEHKRVGETSNMLDIVTSLQLASKVIRP